ncbi:MAG TPA: TerD family protein [Actinocrinis sp.]|nr:TerD family protein [Actinocrinis sp.]
MLDTLIIGRTLRVPRIEGPAGDGAGAARQADAVLLSVGFKAAGPLLGHLSGLDHGTAVDAAVRILAAVRGLVGDDAEHNVYFKDFPANVPDTVEFWLERLNLALAESAPDGHPDGPATVLPPGLNLLGLPGYGTYQHTYAEMLAAHEELIPSVRDRVTVLHLGGTLDEEVHALYLDLAGSTTPLSEDDQHLLGLAAVWCVDGPHPETIPVRENRAVINRVRLADDQPLLADTVTDVLRLACALSGGDVSLSTPTRLRSLPRRDRRALLAALDGLVGANPAKLGDVLVRREEFKRLGERLHPHEYPQFPHAADVFAVARGTKSVRSLGSRVQEAFGAGDVRKAVGLLANSPGLLVRSLDRAARAAAAGADPQQAAADLAVVREAVDRVAGKASGRVLLSLREHLGNRTAPDPARLFVNRAGRAWAAPDRRAPLDAGLVADLTGRLDRELAGRLPRSGHLVVDPEVYDVALPLSGKDRPGGFRVLPRGSRTRVESDHLRFFIHWKENRRSTDYDLSALLLDEDLAEAGQLSFTSLAGYGGVHSGDITEAPDGASEFIDLDLAKVPAKYIVPQVHVYSGEGFHEAAESYFGYMALDADQFGRPYEASTVRMRSDLRGPSRVALPLLFTHEQDGSWSALWTHLFVRGEEWGNRVESSAPSTALLVQTIMERRYLRVGDLIEMMLDDAENFSEYKAGLEFDGPVTYIGIEQPQGLPEGSEVITLDRINALVPA